MIEAMTPFGLTGKSKYIFPAIAGFVFVGGILLLCLNERWTVATLLAPRNAIVVSPPGISTTSSEYNALHANPINESTWSFQRDSTVILAHPVGCDVYGPLVFTSPEGRHVILPSSAGDQLDTCGSSDHDEIVIGAVSNPEDSTDGLIIATDSYSKCVTTSGLAESCPLVDYIYSYNTQTETLQVLYSTTSPNDFELVPIATEGLLLIMKTQTVGTNDPCGQTWFISNDPAYIGAQFYSLDLAQLYIGVREYAVQDYLKQRDALREAICEKALEFGS